MEPPSIVCATSAMLPLVNAVFSCCLDYPAILHLLCNCISDAFFKCIINLLKPTGDPHCCMRHIGQV